LKGGGNNVPGHIGAMIERLKRIDFGIKEGISIRID